MDSSESHTYQVLDEHTEADSPANRSSASSQSTNSVTRVSKRLSHECNTILNEVAVRFRSLPEGSQSCLGENKRARLMENSCNADINAWPAVTELTFSTCCNIFASRLAGWIFGRSEVGDEDDAIDFIKHLQWRTRCEAAIAFAAASAVLHAAIGAWYMVHGLHSAGLVLLCFVAAFFAIVVLIRTASGILVFGLEKLLTLFILPLIGMVMIIPSIAYICLGGGVENSGVLLLTLLSPTASLFLLRQHPVFYSICIHGIRTLLVAFMLSFEEAHLTSPRNATQPERLAVLIVCQIVCPALIAYMVQRAVKEFRWWEDAVEELRKEQEEQQAINQRLVDSLVPAGAADVMLEALPSTGESGQMDLYNECSVVQMDISGFTALSATISAEDLVDLINAVFSSIDEAALALGKVWKVETIGDCFKAVVGGIIPCDDHPDRAVALALAILDVVHGTAARLGIALTARCGVHSGPVTAAVVGRLLPRYHIYGASAPLPRRQLV